MWNNMDIKDTWNKTKLRSSKPFQVSESNFLLPKIDSSIIKRRKQQRKFQGFSVWSKAEFSSTKILPSSKQAKSKKDKELLICPLCFYSTFVPQRMINHEKTHCDEQPHKCNYCSRGFALKSSLTNHLKSHSNHSLKNIKCEISK